MRLKSNRNPLPIRRIGWSLFFAATLACSQIASGSEGFESFEGLQPGGNIVDAGYLRVSGPTTLPSGVTISGPFPSPGAEPPIVIPDPNYAFGFGLADNGDIVSTNLVPDGVAFIAVSNADESRPLEFTFPTDMKLVSALVTAAYSDQTPTPPGRTITLTGFNAAGDSIVSHSVQSVHASLWNTNQLSIFAPGIRRVTVQGYVLVLDSLAFSTVPEPHSLALAGMSFVVTFWRRPRRKP